MTKLDLIYKIPDIIHHKTWGDAELEFINFSKEINRVGLQYRHKDKRVSYGTIKPIGKKYMMIYFHSY
ncbi:hypothetical protein [Mucilaginibacter sp.]|uniref:hypothetical protein n=1 Tax=Mucilaginibacter sp. TaxID=1882438 RepID=UPI003D0DD64A